MIVEPIPVPAPVVPVVDAYAMSNMERYSFFT